MTSSPAVLVVDDNVDLAENLAELFELEGARVDVACDGRDALEKLSKGRYDLVLTDMRMPRVSGLALVQQLKDRAPHIPIVVMTAYSNDEHLDDARAEGALEVLPKPVDLGRVSELVRRLAPDTASVLVVEDDPAHRVNLTELLMGQDGVLPHPTKDAPGADRLAPLIDPAVAIVDLRLPGESGLSLAQRLLARFDRLRVVFVTGHAADLEGVDEDVRARCDVVEKPYAVELLLRRVRQRSSRTSTE